MSEQIDLTKHLKKKQDEKSSSEYGLLKAEFAVLMRTKIVEAVDEILLQHPKFRKRVLLRHAIELAVASLDGPDLHLKDELYW